MKTFRNFLLLTFAVIMTAMLTGCNKDNDPEVPSQFLTQEEFNKSVWTGQNAKQDAYEIKIVSSDQLQLNIVSKNGTVYVDNEKLPYSYNPKDGKFTSEYDGTAISGSTSKTTMTFTLSGETITLNKK